MRRGPDGGKHRCPEARSAGEFYRALGGRAPARKPACPPDVLPVVTGEGPVAGSALADAADFLMFTGGTATEKSSRKKPLDA